jgi:hypothetical protein
MAEIKLPCGRLLLVDDSDLTLVNQYVWFSAKRRQTFYARGYLRGTDDRNQKVYLHKLLTGNVQTDHWDGNGLNNHRVNLRKCNSVQNAGNAKSQQHKKFRGTYFDRRKNLWYAQLFIGRKARWGGYHSTEIGAARAFDIMARERFGEFARLNLPDAHA